MVDHPFVVQQAAIGLLEWIAAKFEDFGNAQLSERLAPDGNAARRALLVEDNLPVLHANGQQIAIIAPVQEAFALDLIVDVVDAIPLVRAGSIKAYAVSSDARLDIAPDIPTFRELGLPTLSLSDSFSFPDRKDIRLLYPRLDTAARTRRQRALQRCAKRLRA